MYKLKFGTAGIRGIMGDAPGEFNINTIKLLSRALARFLLKDIGEVELQVDEEMEPADHEKVDASSCENGDAKLSPLVIIARDSRNNSLEFALQTAKTLKDEGLRVLMFEEIMPVPVLSFAVRYLKADAGVVITASHNTKEYNGYKVYGPNGGQILSEAADQIQKEIELLQKALVLEAEESEVSKNSEESLGGKEYETDKISAELFIGEVVYRAYTEAVKEASNYYEPASSELSVIYTPLHGSGRRPVTEILSEDGFNLFVVPEQEQADGNFSTCGQPNPEFPSAYELALKYAERRAAEGIDSDIIIATDPDCDRVGAMCKLSSQPDSGKANASDESAKYRLLSGNELGSLVLAYICEKADMRGRVFVSSFVSSPLADRIARANGMEVVKTQVGFKYIADQMDLAGEKFAFAFEESNGMLAGLYARDKDGVLGASLICKAAACLKAEGKTLADKLEELNELYGPVLSRTISAALQQGEEKPETQIEDFDDGSRVVIRPSGTEPKIKYYFFADSEERLKKLIDEYCSQDG